MSLCCSPHVFLIECKTALPSGTEPSTSIPKKTPISIPPDDCSLMYWTRVVAATKMFNLLQTIDFYVPWILDSGFWALGSRILDPGCGCECGTGSLAWALPPGWSSNWAVKSTKAERVVQIIIAIITTITSWFSFCNHLLASYECTVKKSQKSQFKILCCNLFRT